MPRNLWMWPYLEMESMQIELVKDCYGLIFVIPPFLAQNSLLKPNAPWDGVRRWALGKWFGHEGGALINGRVLCKKDPTTLPRLFYRVSLQEEAAACTSELNLMVGFWTHSYPGSPASRPWNEFLLFIKFLVRGTKTILDLGWPLNPVD